MYHLKGMLVQEAAGEHAKALQAAEARAAKAEEARKLAMQGCKKSEVRHPAGTLCLSEIARSWVALGCCSGKCLASSQQESAGWARHCELHTLYATQDN